MEYILDENGNIKIGPSGMPMVKNGDSEIELDAIGAQAKITAITTESNDRRKSLGEANAKLATFAGIEDPTKALAAIQKVNSYDKDLTVQLDNLKGEVNKAWEAKEAAWVAEKEGLNSNLFKANVLNNFSSSPVAKTLVLTPSIAATVFGGNFNADGTAKGADGNQLYSPSRPGEPANFDESLTILIDQHPDKESLLRAKGQSGGDGFKTGEGTGEGEAKTSVEMISAGLAARK